MKPNEEANFSWSGLFIVSSFSFFAFSWLIKFIHGSTIHSAFFIKTGVLLLVLSVFSYANSLNKPTEKKKRRRPASSYLQHVNRLQ